LKKLDLFIVKAYIGPFILTFFITLFVFEMQFLWQYFEDMVGKGLEGRVLIELFFYASASFVGMALPLAILLSSIMTFGNMGENYELVSIKAAGISLRRAMQPLIILTVILSLLAFYFSNNIMPVANLKFKSLLYDIMHQKPTLDFQPGVFYKGLEGYVIRIKDKDPKTQLLKNVLIYDHTELTGNRKVIMAETGEMYLSENGHYLIFKLYNGANYDEQKNIGHPLLRSTFNEHTINFELSGFAFKRTDEDLFKDHYQMLNLSQLKVSSDSLLVEKKERYAVFTNAMTERLKSFEEFAFNDSASTFLPSNLYYDSLDTSKKMAIINTAQNIARGNKTFSTAMRDEYRSREERIARHHIEWHRKFTLSIACILLFFIGAPMGAIIRKGGLGMPVVVSVVFFLLYHIVSITGEKLVKNLEILPWQGMWLSSFVLLPIGIFLTYKATTDAMILDTTFYNQLSERFKNTLLGKYIHLLKQRFKNKNESSSALS